jgi:hypothetical protein
MAFNWSALTTEIQGVIQATWSDCVEVLTAAQANRRSYETIGRPFAIVMVSNAEEGDWGLANAAWEVRIDFHYIRTLDAAQTCYAAVQNKLEALKSALFAASYATSGATLLTVEIDFSSHHFANELFEAKNAPLVGGRLSANFVCGETAL